MRIALVQFLCSYRGDFIFHCRGCIVNRSLTVLLLVRFNARERLSSSNYYIVLPHATPRITSSWEKGTTFFYRVLRLVHFKTDTRER